MKNSQKGFIVPVLLAIIILLIVSVGVYIYETKKAEAPVVDTGTPQTAQVKGITIEQPLINQEIQLPVTVKGYINGNGWSAFEGVAGSVQVFDANGKAITERTPLQATTDWMQPVVHFEITIGDANMMNNLATQTGVLVFKNENTKGDPANDKEFRLPIKFTK